MNIMMLLEMSAGAMGDRVAVGDIKHGLTYEQLFDLAGKGATWLRRREVDRVLYSDLSNPMLPVALFASAWAGKPFVPVSYRLPDDRLRALVQRQSPAVVLCGSGTQERFGEIDGVELVSTGAFQAGIESSETAEGDWGFDEDDIAILLHTSGTSGDPKVAIMRQKNLTSYVIGSVEFMGAGEDEATLVSVPPYHIAGMAALLSSAYSGRRVYQLPNFEPSAWVHAAREQHITHAMVVPTMMGRILEIIEEDGLGLPALRNLSYGGGRMPVPVIEKAMALLPHVNFVNAYGLTETASTISILGPQDHRDAMASEDLAVRARIGSVGRPLPTVEIVIMDDDGNTLEPGQQGEVYVRGEQVSGEYTGKKLTNDQGWFATKDGGYFDEGGFLFITGRMDDVIVRGGENLSPGEIEDVMLTHPAVADVAVIGLPDTDWGETVAAVVVLHEHQGATEQELKDHVMAQLRSARTPTIIEFRTELPYNDTGKVLRRVLRQELSARSV